MQPIITIRGFAEAVNLPEVCIRSALAYYAGPKTKGRATDALTVADRWAQMAERPAVAEWLTRCLRLKAGK